MTFNEVKIQYVLGLITLHRYAVELMHQVERTTNNKELIQFFWMLIDWEENIKNKKYDNICNYFGILNAFRKNEYAPAYLRKIIQPLATNRPLPENILKLYPR